MLSQMIKGGFNKVVALVWVSLQSNVLSLHIFINTIEYRRQMVVQFELFGDKRQWWIGLFVCHI
jgi:hypothetical protein